MRRGTAAVLSPSGNSTQVQHQFLRWLRNLPLLPLALEGDSFTWVFPFGKNDQLFTISLYVNHFNIQMGIIVHSSDSSVHNCSPRLHSALLEADVMPSVSCDFLSPIYGMELYQETLSSSYPLSSLPEISWPDHIQPLKLDSNCPSSIQLSPKTYGIFNIDFISTFII